MPGTGHTLGGADTLDEIYDNPPRPPRHCPCGHPIIWARLHHNGRWIDVPLDATDNHEPATVTDGEYTLVATTRDTLGRTALAVELDEHGNHSDHRASCEQLERT